MAPDRTPEGKVVLYSVATGERLERWPVDARGMLGTGDYTMKEPASSTSSGVSAPAPIADPLPHVTQAIAQNEAQSPTGAPLLVSPASGVQPAAPVQLPTGRAPGGKRGKP